MKITGVERAMAASVLAQVNVPCVGCAADLMPPCPCVAHLKNTGVERPMVASGLAQADESCMGSVAGLVP